MTRGRSCTRTTEPHLGQACASHALSARRLSLGLQLPVAVMLQLLRPPVWLMLLLSASLTVQSAERRPRRRASRLARVAIASREVRGCNGRHRRRRGSLQARHAAH